MGNSLHNKIYLGRGAVVAARTRRAGVALGLVLVVALSWYVLHAAR